MNWREMVNTVFFELDVKAIDALAVESRMKNFLRHGFLSHRKLGRGRSAKFTESEAQQMVKLIAMNLTGVTPQMALSIIEAHPKDDGYWIFVQAVGDYRTTIVLEKACG